MITVTLACINAFDKFKFDKLFGKLLDKNVPAIVVMALIFTYEEQTGCVKLAGHRYENFSITGTRQG